MPSHCSRVRSALKFDTMADVIILGIVNRFADVLDRSVRIIRIDNPRIARNILGGRQQAYLTASNFFLVDVNSLADHVQ